MTREVAWNPRGGHYLPQPVSQDSTRQRLSILQEEQWTRGELSARAEQARDRWGPPQELQRWANRQKADWAEHRPLFQDLQMTCEEAAPDGSGNSLKGLSSPPRTDAPAAHKL